MASSTALDAALDALPYLLDQQAQAVLDGQADALPGLSVILNSRLAALRASITRLPTPEQQDRLRALHGRARANQDMLNRRQLDVQRAIDALGQGDPLLQSAQSNRVYAAAGMLTAPAVRGRGFVQA
ncbi:hypothetical protein [uncultured Ramlibacter sp.]|uniref:hypothetical protein n=1 Tax=uncultured Ramlibacter sp. TaxID=260755 RepID=UPI00260AB2AD|nr:hypothetical protein [uncultured Ramlibacter sp.]